jgi:putative membrane protein
MEEVGSAGAFQVAAVGRVAVAHPEGGDELMIEFTKEDYEVASAAIREAEKRTSGQIVCVLAHSSSEYAYVPILWASVLALAAPWPLIEFTQWSVQRIFVLQLVVFILAGFLFSWMPLRVALVPRPIQRVRAHRAALEQFVVRRVAHTRNRSGILIFVSMAEHYARVIADEGIAQKVHQAEWQAAINSLTEHIGKDRIAAGFVAAIERCGAILAAYAPPDGSANELPDRLYVI